MKEVIDLQNFFGVKEGKKYQVTKVGSRVRYQPCTICQNDIFVVIGRNIVFKEKNTSCEINILTDLEYVEKIEILNDEEKEYLGTVIKPFRKQVKGISKEKVYSVKQGKEDNEKAFICIGLLHEEDILLPYFERDKMYKGMELDREYTLKELGL